MADDTKALAKQVDKLAERLDKIEASLGSGKSTGGADRMAGQVATKGCALCALPEVPERQFATNVSPAREELIRIIEKKWVNGTRLHYYFFKKGPWAGPYGSEETSSSKVSRSGGTRKSASAFEPVDDIAAPKSASASCRATAPGPTWDAT